MELDPAIQAQLERILATKAAELDPTPYYSTPDQVVVPTDLNSKETRVCYILSGSGALVRRDTIALSVTTRLPDGEKLNRLADVEDGRLYSMEECGVSHVPEGAAPPKPGPGYGVIRTLSDLFTAAPGHEEVYALCRSGVCMIYRSGGYALVQTGIKSVPGLPTPELDTFEFKFGKPGKHLLRQFQKLAQAFHRNPGTEVGCILLYDLEERDYVIVPPYQTVRDWSFTWYAENGGAMSLSTPEYVDPRYAFIGVIHSHRDAPAFESGTDRDQLHKPMDFAVSVIMGKVTHPEPDVKYFQIVDGAKTSDSQGVPCFFEETGKPTPEIPDWWYARCTTSAPTHEIDLRARLMDALEEESDARRESQLGQRTVSYGPPATRFFPRSVEEWNRATTGFRVPIVPVTDTRPSVAAYGGDTPAREEMVRHRVLSQLDARGRYTLLAFLGWMDRQLGGLRRSDRERGDILFPILFYAWKAHPDLIWEAREYAEHTRSPSEAHLPR